jgi:Fur family ferric uptake transcriptional regulator
MGENKSQLKGMKKTHQRESILVVLEHSEQPLSARDICSRIETEGEGTWLSTVYRVLELFVKNGLVIKTKMINNGMALYELNRAKHKHYAVCLNCHQSIALDSCPIKNAFSKLEECDFTVTGHNLEVFGYCKKCAPK